MPTGYHSQDGGRCLVFNSYGVVCGPAYPSLLALLFTGISAVHLVRVMVRKVDYGKRSRSFQPPLKTFILSTLRQTRGNRADLPHARRPAPDIRACVTHPTT